MVPRFATYACLVTLSRSSVSWSFEERSISSHLPAHHASDQLLHVMAGAALFCPARKQHMIRQSRMAVILILNALACAGAAGSCASLCERDAGGRACGQGRGRCTGQTSILTSHSATSVPSSWLPSPCSALHLHSTQFTTALLAPCSPSVSYVVPSKLLLHAAALPQCMLKSNSMDLFSEACCQASEQFGVVLISMHSVMDVSACWLAVTLDAGSEGFQYLL